MSPFLRYPQSLHSQSKDTQLKAVLSSKGEMDWGQNLPQGQKGNGDLWVISVFNGTMIVRGRARARGFGIRA